MGFGHLVRIGRGSFNVRVVNVAVRAVRSPGFKPEMKQRINPIGPIPNLVRALSATTYLGMKIPTLSAPKEMERILQLHGLKTVFQPNNIFPNRESEEQRFCETGGRDDQQSKLAAQEAHSHIMTFLETSIGVNDGMNWKKGGTVNHIGGGTITLYDVLRRCPTDEKGVPVDPFTALEMKTKKAQAWSAALIRNWCVNDMSDRPWDVVKDSLQRFFEAGIRMPIVFDANNRRHAITDLAVETIRQGASCAIAYSVARYPGDPTVFNPWEMADWFIQSVEDIQEAFKESGETITLQTILDHLVFYNY